MSTTRYFSENERTEQQRRDVVNFAVGVSLSQNRPPSPFLVDLQNQYIAGEIDLEQLSAKLDAEYLFAPGPDPYAKYAPGEGPEVEPAPEYSPYLEFDDTQVVSLGKVLIAEKEPGSLTAHLLPVVAFLKAQGNAPSAALSYAQQNPDGFNFDHDGVGVFLFEKPLDVAAIRAHFDFPPTIGFTPEGDVWDDRNRVGIMQLHPISEADAAYDWE